MHIKNLQLLNFLSHISLNLTELSSLIQIIGPNGSGKTNILEAISLLAPGRGLHRRHFAELLSYKQSHYTDWLVRAELEDERILATGAVILNSNNIKRVAFIDGDKLINQNELLKIVRIIWLTPQMDDLFLAPAANRRKFLDRLTYNFYPEHAVNVAKYDYYMRSRLKLLLNNYSDQLWLNQLEGKMAEYALLIFQARDNAITLMQAHLDNNSFSTPIIKLENGLDIITLEAISKKLHDNRRIDSSKGRSHFGPHKTEMITTHADKKIAATCCSTGEQKAMLIALMIAQAKAINNHFLQQPIVLLDELFTHLDHGVQQYVLKALIGVKAQIWSTSTEYQFGTEGETIVRLQH
jgi:DNA replication and repair protein RecF